MGTHQSTGPIMAFAADLSKSQQVPAWDQGPAPALISQAEAQRAVTHPQVPLHQAVSDFFQEIKIYRKDTTLPKAVHFSQQVSQLPSALEAKPKATWY